MAPPTLTQLFTKELQSFKSPPPKEVAPVPKVGEPAPSHEKVKLPDKPTIVVFLRHCGCPFAEKTFRSLTAFSVKHHPQIHCIAVSHSSEDATTDWVEHVGGAWETHVVVDEDRDAYAAWGLGLSSYWHAIGPFSIYNAVQLGKTEGIWNRTTESGTRWQMSGAFATDRRGIVRWASVPRSASELPDFDAALKALISVPTEVTAEVPNETHLKEPSEVTADVHPKVTTREPREASPKITTEVLTKELPAIPREVTPEVPAKESAEVPIEAVSTEAPTKKLPEVPIEVPTEVPTEEPTKVPAEVPPEISATDVSTDTPTEEPTEMPTKEPTKAASEVPIDIPTEAPADVRTKAPIEVSMKQPTEEATEISTKAPIEAPVEAPIEPHTEVSTDVPSEVHTKEPTEIATEVATDEPVKVHTKVTTEA